jgi:DNA-binding transcriptional LysR family regulator
MARAFGEAGGVPKIVVSATDSDVIKGYVAAGLGIGIVPSIAVANPAGEMLTARDVTDLFPATRTVIGLRRDTYLRSHAALFISRVAPEWDRTAIARAIASKSRSASPG